jgi:autotransporter translocation and assembly factor TamB
LKKFFKYTVISLGSVTVFVTVVAAAVVLFSRTERGQRLLREIVQSQFDANLNGRLVFADISYDFPLSIQITGIKIYVANDSLPAVQADTLSLSVDLTKSHFENYRLKQGSVSRFALVSPIVVLHQDTAGVLNLLRLLKPSPPTVGTKDTTLSPSIPITLTSIEIRNGDFRYISDRKPSANTASLADSLAAAHGLDMTNLHVTKLVLSASLETNTKFDYLKTTIGTFSFYLPDAGRELASLTATVDVSKTKTSISNFKLGIGKSKIVLDAKIDSVGLLSGFTMADLAKSTVSLKLNADRLHADDLKPFIKTFVPKMQLEKGDYGFTVEAKGKVRDLQIKSLTIHTPRSSVSAAGRVEGLPKLETLFIDIKTGDCSLSLVEPQLLFPTLDIPDYSHVGKIKFSGTFKGKLTDFATNLTMQTEGGTFIGSLRLKLPKHKPIEYDGSVHLSNFNPALFLQDSSFIGNLNVTGDVSGKGLAIDELQSSFVGRLDSSIIGGRRIHLAELDVKADHKVFQGSVRAESEDAELSFTGQVDFSNNLPIATGSGNLKNLDLSRFLKNDSLKTNLSARYTIDGFGDRLANLNGNFSFRFDSSYYHNVLIPPSTSVEVSIDQIDKNHASFRLASSFADGEITGQFNLQEVLTVVEVEAKHLSEEILKNNIFQSEKQKTKFAKLKADLAVERRDTANINVQYKLAIKNFSYLAQLLESDFSAVGKTAGTLKHNAGSTAFSANLQLDSVRYGKGVSVRGFVMGFHYNDVRTGAVGKIEKNTISADMVLDVDRMRQGKAIFRKTYFKGKFSDKTLTFNLRTSNLNTAALIDFDGKVTNADGRYTATLPNVTFATQDYLWQNQKPLLFSVSRENLDIQRFVLVNDNQKISATGSIKLTGEGFASLEVSNLDLSQVSRFIYDDGTPRLSGRASLTTSVSGNFQSPIITARLTGDSLAYQQIKIGQLRTAAKYQDKSIKVSLAVNAAEVETDSSKGEIATKSAQPRPNTIIGQADFPMDLSFVTVPTRLLSTQPLAATLKAENIDLKVLEYFTDAVRDVSGSGSFNLTAKGTYDDPDIAANLLIPQLSMFVTSTEVPYTLSADVSLSPTEYKINRIRLIDGLGGSGTASGSIAARGFVPQRFDIQADLRKLKVLDKKDVIEEQPAGYATITSHNVRFSGTPKQSLFEADFTVNSAKLILLKAAAERSTLFTEASKFLKIVARYDSAASLAALNAERNRTFDEEDDSLVAQMTKPASGGQTNSFADGFTMNLTLKMEGQTSFKLSFDKYLGNELDAQITGQLAVNYAANQLKISGTTTVEKGKYDFYGTRFDINDPGTLQWNNAGVKEATLDITAEHSVKVPNPTTSVIEAITIKIGLSGTLDKLNPPLFTYTKDGTIFTKAEDPNIALNAIYLTSRQWYAYPGSQGAFRLADASNAALGQATGFVSGQLSRIAGSIGGIQAVNLDVTRDNNSGTTGLDLTVAYAIPGTDNRLILTGTPVATGYGSSSKSTGLFGNSLKMEYRLSNKITLEAFRNNDRSPLIANETENVLYYGAGVAYREDFRTWGELGKRWQSYLFDVSSFFTGLFSKQPDSKSEPHEANKE